MLHCYVFPKIITCIFLSQWGGEIIDKLPTIASFSQISLLYTCRYFWQFSLSLTTSKLIKQLRASCQSLSNHFLFELHLMVHLQGMCFKGKACLQLSCIRRCSFRVNAQTWMPCNITYSSPSICSQSTCKVARFDSHNQLAK